VRHTKGSFAFTERVIKTKIRMTLIDVKEIWIFNRKFIFDRKFLENLFLILKL